jgi:hypothetical protein
MPVALAAPVGDRHEDAHARHRGAAGASRHKRSLFSGYSRTLGLKKPLPWRQAMSILLQLAGSHGAYAVSRSISVCT